MTGLILTIVGIVALVAGAAGVIFELIVDELTVRAGAWVMILLAGVLALLLAAWAVR